jgi:hypothetical protein
MWILVHLSGVVETEAQRAQAAYLTKQVRGVIMVNNNLQIQNRTPADKAHPQKLKISDKDPLSGGAILIQAQRWILKPASQNNIQS